MYLNELSDYVQCCFGKAGHETIFGEREIVDVFFADAEDIDLTGLNGTGFYSVFDKLSRDQGDLTKEKFTRIACNSFMRILISKKLGMEPDEIPFSISVNGKPGIVDNKLYFNISHTKSAFVIGISQDIYIGADIESRDNPVDYERIMKRFFSKKEVEFILQEEGEPRERFFLLWTRKEALLKAFGTGIITNLADIEVCDPVNILNRKSFDQELGNSIVDNHFIYSGMIYNNYLSIALPKIATIKLNHLDKSSFRALAE
jgi:phosphopantetheinyl transferase